MYYIKYWHWSWTFKTFELYNIVFYVLASHAWFVFQLEFQLEQERYQRGELEKSRRKLEGDGRSTQESLAQSGKMRSGLEELIKRSVRDTLGTKMMCCMKTICCWSQ